MSSKIHPGPQQLIRAAAYTWRNRDGSTVPGIGIFVDRRLIQHMTVEQATVFADQLVDAAEATEGSSASNTDHKKTACDVGLAAALGAYAKEIRS